MSDSTTLKSLKRPLIVCLFLAVFAEFLMFLIFGVLLYPDGNLLAKFLWTVLFCGVGMGSAMGVFVVLFVVEKLKGVGAIVACILISTLLLGFGCNFLCFLLDKHFHYFGGHESPLIFISNGIIMSALGGLISGYLLFTKKGDKILQRVGI